VILGYWAPAKFYPCIDILLLDSLRALFVCSLSWGVFVFLYQSTWSAYI